jgi:hypothetical protein
MTELTCQECGMAWTGDFTKEQIADWLRVHGPGARVRSVPRQ